MISKRIRKHNYLILVLVLTILPFTGFSQNDKPAGTGLNFDLNSAQWITADTVTYKSGGVCPVFRKDFNLDKKVKKASLFITAHGLYEARINGKKVGNGLFTPGFTAYGKRLQVQQYDCTSLFSKNPRSSSIEVTVGDGWWRGRFGNQGKRNNYGNDASLLCRLLIEYADGTSKEIVSDGSWSVGEGPICFADIYDGETYDASVGYRNFQPVQVSSFAKNNLVATVGNPVIRQQELRPRALIGDSILDFGQNIAGWVKISVRGKKGDTIKIYHAEALDSLGRMFRRNLRSAKAMDTYILSGNGTETFEPHFTYHGFRYARIVGTKANLKDFRAVVLHTDLKPTGAFSCSNPKLNQLHSNILWSMKGNFFDIPTDCPQRAERLGWGQDADVFCETASYLMNVTDFYKKWLLDLEAEQHESGSVSPTVPSHWGNNTMAIAGWGDAATFTPWTLYQAYGDLSILRDQYRSMKAWVDYLGDAGTGYISKASLKRFGDWYPAGPETDMRYLNQCYYYRSTWIVLETAKLLGMAEDVSKYAGVLAAVKAAFDQEFLGKVPETQTAYVLGLHFGLLPDSSIEKLVDLIKASNYHLATGFMGTPYLLHVLSRFGYADVAYRVLLQESPPSWLNMVNRGATTMWEMWDGIRPDGSFAKGGDVSLNHYAFGSVGSWMYRNILGIAPLSPGCAKVLIRPLVGGGLSWAKGSYLSAYGRIAVSWRLSADRVLLSVEVPKGVAAEVHVPGEQSIQTVGAGKHHFTGKTNL